jgi:putative membrane protein
MNHPFIQLLLRWLVLAAGVTIAANVIDGIRCDSRETLIVVVLLLSFFNAILRPLLVLLALPFIVLTLGLGMVVINALLFLLVDWLVDGFHVASFWSAVAGAIIVSLTGWAANLLIRQNPPRGPHPPGGSSGGHFGGWTRPAPRVPERKTPPGKGDVIDI